MLLQKLFNTKAPVFTSHDHNTGRKNLESLFTVFMGIREYYKTQNADYIRPIQRHIRTALNFAPAFDNGHNWGYPVLCACLLLIKENPSLWNSFTSLEQ